MDYKVPSDYQPRCRIASSLASDSPLVIRTNVVLFCEGISEQTIYYCWQTLASEMMIHQMTVGCADLDNTPTTHQLPASTLNISNNSSIGSSSSSNKCSAATGRIPPPPATVAKITFTLPVTPSMPPNWPSVGESQQMTDRKPDFKANDCTVPLVTTATLASSTGTSSADTMTIATAVVPSSSS
ncbi:unnamed protein product [Taenia asiatica]|uniref:Uncharacterized protein n=1 Tax=Taenia asiatica TaxID=60517 RepID=A0A0R3VX91_TAEAS|nr:unnamed protein product [Taenia asiatica]